MGIFLNPQSIDVDIEAKNDASIPSIRLPMSLEDRMAQMADVMNAMGDEAPGPVRHEAAANAQLLDFLSTAPPQLNLAERVSCAGVGLYTNNGNTVYYMPVYVGAYLPSGGVPIIKSESGTYDEQGRLTNYGRMGGSFGWSKDRNLIAGALASFTHNFVALLALFASRAKLPQSQPWSLPNLVLSETRAPSQFVLPATYTYRTIRPAYRTKFILKTSSDTPITLGFDWWNAGKNDVTRVDQLKLAAGENTIILGARVPMSGIFTVNPIDAPHGLTIESAYTIPGSI